MREYSKVKVSNGGSAPDPIAATGDVPQGLIVDIPPVIPGSSTLCSSVRLGLAAPSGNVTVELWALVEPPFTPRPIEPPDPADRVFLLIATGVAVDANTLSAPIPVPTGRIYVRQTAGTIPADTDLLITLAV